MSEWKPRENRTYAGRVVGGPKNGQWIVGESPWLHVPSIQSVPLTPGDDALPSPVVDTVTYVFVDDDNTWRLQ